MNTSTNANRNPSSTERAAHNKVESAAEGAHSAVDWAADKAGKARGSLSDTGHDFKETQEKWLAETRKYMQANPMTTIGIAVASGFLLSRLLRSS